MLLSAITLFGIIAVSNARPNAISPHNVVVVPPNCAPGQAWVNGQCRDVWRLVPAPIILPKPVPAEIENASWDSKLAKGPQNVVVVPPNCPPGQAWVNGQCRDVWRLTAAPIILPKPVPAEIENAAWDFKSAKGPQNVVVVPPNCPPGQAWVNGQCRDVWLLAQAPIILPKPIPAEIENAEWNFKSANSPQNVVVVPPNCPTGQVLVNGQCRDVWLLAQAPMVPVDLKQAELRTNQESTLKNTEASSIITVPNQCPIGYKPDANGICRKIF